MASEKYVSRGGDKLEGALGHFGIEVKGKLCLDIGASTGGFTDCLLVRGADRVWCVDTAYGELAWKLRQDPRVRVLEKTNILFDSSKLDEILGRADLVVIDVGWTRLTKVIPIVLGYLKPAGEIVALIKPQYEIVKGNSKQNRNINNKKKMILTDGEAVEVANRIRDELSNLSYIVSEIYPSPVRGESGNQEYFIRITKL